MQDEANAMLFGGGAPSFKFEKVGDAVTGEIVAMDKRQQTGIDDGKPLYWDDGSPRMMLVLTLQTSDGDGDDDDGRRSIYLRGGNYQVASGKGTSLLVAVRDAVKRAGSTNGIESGGILTVQWSGEGVAKRGFTAPKLYTAAYKAPVSAVSLEDLA